MVFGDSGRGEEGALHRSSSGRVRSAAVGPCGVLALRNHWEKVETVLARVAGPGGNPAASSAFFGLGS